MLIAESSSELSKIVSSKHFRNVVKFNEEMEKLFLGGFSYLKNVFC